MFERFTNRARRSIVIAQEEARRLGHNYIGTEHILLGLLGDTDSLAAKVLRAFEIDVDAARAAVGELIGEGGAAPSGHIPFTPRAKQVLELALREALQLGHNYIGTEHQLLGLLRESEGIGARVLFDRGATYDAVRDKIIELLAGGPSDDVTEHAEAEGERAAEALGERWAEARRERAAEALAKVGPTCPRCPAPFPDQLRSRRTRVPGYDGPVMLAYCGRCGATVALLP